MTDAIQLLEAIERHHPEPYRYIAPETLREQAERATHVRPGERNHGVIELMRLAALLGERNGHTGILPWREQTVPFELYPIRGYEFEEGVFVIAAAERDLIGCELVAIAGTPLADVMAEVSPLIPHDNEWTVRARWPRFAMAAEVLRGLAIVNSSGPVAWRVRTPHGELREVELEPLPAHDCERVLDLSPPPRSVETTEGGAALYAAYNVTRGETASFATVIASRARTARAIVLDLRQNAGGDSETYGPLLATLEQLAVAGKQLAVLTSRTTFSAAMHLVVDLEQRTPAIFVGEPTGASPNHYGDPVTVILHQSGVEARVATISWTTAGAGDTRTTREPDVFVPLSAAAFFSRADPVRIGALEQLGCV